MSNPNNAAIQLLFDNLASLPHEEYGTINMLPFAHDSDQVRTIKRHVCEAIVGLLDANGFIRHDTPDAEPTVVKIATIKCAEDQCDSEMLLALPVSDDGVAFVNAPHFISTVSTLNPQCPHATLTLDDMRAHMESEFWASTCRGCSVETSELTEGLCADCTAKDKGKQ